MLPQLSQPAVAYFVTSLLISTFNPLVPTATPDTKP
jgi:hypothetical protein